LNVMLICFAIFHGQWFSRGWVGTTMLSGGETVYFPKETGGLYSSLKYEPLQVFVAFQDNLGGCQARSV
jgi:hypothetical protein